MPHRQNDPAQVLLLEDSLSIRGLLKRLIEATEPQAQVLALADGAEGLAALRQRRFDLLITDVQMPGLDGRELLRCAGLEGRLAHTAVLVFSSVLDLAQQLDPSGLHSLALLRKPAPAGEIQRAVRALLGPEAHRERPLALV